MFWTHPWRGTHYTHFFWSLVGSTKKDPLLGGSHLCTRVWVALALPAQIARTNREMGKRGRISQYTKAQNWVNMGSATILTVCAVPEHGVLIYTVFKQHVEITWSLTAKPLSSKQNCLTKKNNKNSISLREKK